MNPKQLQQAIDTPEMHSLVKSYLMARAYAELTREQVDRIYSEILDEIPVYADQSLSARRGGGERITENKYLYLCTDENTLNRIYDEADKRLKAAGIKPANMERDYCPALVAEDELRKIKRVIADVSGKPLDISADKLLSQPDALTVYNKWIDLVVGAIVNSPKFEKPAI